MDNCCSNVQINVRLAFCSEREFHSLDKDMDNEMCMDMDVNMDTDTEMDMDRDMTLDRSMDRTSMDASWRLIDQKMHQKRSTDEPRVIR